MQSQESNHSLEELASTSKLLDSAQDPQGKTLLFPRIFDWAQADPVFALVQAEDTELGSRGVHGEAHQLAIMKDATALLDIYEAFMRDRVARSECVFIPWPIDRQDKVDPQDCTYNFPGAVVISERLCFASQIESEGEVPFTMLQTRSSLYLKNLENRNFPL